MQLGKLFEKNYLTGRLGLYPFTPENLMRVGLALCVYLKIHKNLERPIMLIDELNFLTLSLGVGFMAGGDIKVRSEYEGDRARLIIENLQDYELKMVESILFSRYNMPRAEGEEVGKVWIQEKRL